MSRLFSGAFLLNVVLAVSCLCMPLDAQAVHPAQTDAGMVLLDRPLPPAAFPLSHQGRVAPIYVAAEDAETVKVGADAFFGDIEKVTGKRPQLLSAEAAEKEPLLILVGTVGHSSLIDRLRSAGKLDTSSIDGKWESAVTTVVNHPFSGVRQALVIAGSDRRGTVFALFTISRQMGVSPWVWWADVPVRHHKSIGIRPGMYVQHEPSVQYRGIFLNDEDWGLRPWAARKMDPELNNIGPHTYARIFELLLRLHANTLWPAMHPGTLPFNAVKENAQLADRWGIVMGSSHSEALLRNNVGEWDEKRDGPWNYQINRPAIDRYWKQRLIENGKFENFYTVGMRGVHDTGLEATGSLEVKAHLVEEVMTSQRQLLREEVSTDLPKVPQVIWLYKESIDLYRTGMKVPEDVTLGWTDDNYGYIRQLPSAAEQKRPGGSGLYYHVSYWGFPHDYLWLCSTPPSLIREEMTKAWDHNVKKLWILNVGDLKPAESDIDYFLQLAWDEPAVSQLSQQQYLQVWNAEQFPVALAKRISDLMERYYRLNFIRRPEFMGFNGYNDDVKRTAFNPLAWGDQNRIRLNEWERLSAESKVLGKQIPAEYRDAYFELVAYPIQAAAAQNAKFLWADRSYLDGSKGNSQQARNDAESARTAYDTIQQLTHEYNSLANGKWDGMMSDAPRNRHVFEMPATGENVGSCYSLPESWKPATADSAPSSKQDGVHEEYKTISIDAAHFTRKHDGDGAVWRVLPELGISGSSIVLGAPGAMHSAPWVSKQQTPVVGDNAWLEYDFDTSTEGEARLAIHLLPTFPLDSDHKLKYAAVLDDGSPQVLDASGSEGGGTNISPWRVNVLRNSAVQEIGLGVMKPGHHKLSLIYGDPGVVFEHIVVTFPGAPPAYPVPPETR